MSKTKFKYLDRGYQKTMVLVPGWAADYRIFDCLDLKFNYLLLLVFSPFTFEDSLLNLLEDKALGKVSLFGWSLGGFLAAEFASRHPDLIDELILVSIRKKYNAKGIDNIKELLKRSKKGYLHKFYSQCFSKKESASWFRENLLKSYCAQFESEYLLKTLDYLGKSRIRPEELTGVEKIKIIHGALDRIAPIKEAESISDDFESVGFITVKDSGHIPFLEADLSRYI